MKYSIHSGTNCFYIKKGDRYTFKTCGDTTDNQRDANELVNLLNSAADKTEMILNVLKDCVECLERLPNVEGAYRVTCIQQVKSCIRSIDGSNSNENEPVTKVVFRKFKEDNSIIALFPEEPGTNDPYTCNSYMFCGHGSASPYITGKTTLATPEEYEELQKELIRLGYNLKITSRLNHRYDIEKRRAAINLGRKTAIV